MSTTLLPVPALRPRKRRVAGAAVRPQARGRTNSQMVRILFLAVAAGLDAVAIFGTAALTGELLGHGSGDFNDLVLGAIVTMLFVVPGRLPA